MTQVQEMTAVGRIIDLMGDTYSDQAEMHRDHVLGCDETVTVGDCEYCGPSFRRLMVTMAELDEALRVAQYRNRTSGCSCGGAPRRYHVECGEGDVMPAAEPSNG